MAQLPDQPSSTHWVFRNSNRITAFIFGGVVPIVLAGIFATLLSGGNPNAPQAYTIETE